MPNDSHALSDNVLGVIDKDVRDYRGEVPEIEPLLVLNYYSIESHFVSEQVIANILRLSSKASRDLISNDLCHLMICEIEEKLLDLYYFSLESLRNSIELEYSANFSYSYSPGRIYDPKTRQGVLEKQHDLDAFASSLGLSPCIDTLKSISKGKWLIDIFSQELIHSINRLPKRCSESSITTCKSCVFEAFDKCLYRIKDGFTKKTIKSLILASVEGAEVQYIEQRISRIKGFA